MESLVWCCNYSKVFKYYSKSTAFYYILSKCYWIYIFYYCNWVFNYSYNLPSLSSTMPLKQLKKRETSVCYLKCSYSALDYKFWRY